MISKSIKLFCNGDITKIENYEEAIADTTKVWHCHHRLEIGPNGEITPVIVLKEKGLYYNRPPEELIFLSPSMHSVIHSWIRKTYEENEKAEAMDMILSAYDNGDHFGEEALKRLYDRRNQAFDFYIKMNKVIELFNTVKRADSVPANTENILTYECEKAKKEIQKLFKVKRHRKCTKVYWIEGERTFDSVEDVAKFFDCSKNTVYKCLRNEIDSICEEEYHLRKA